MCDLTPGWFEFGDKKSLTISHVSVRRSSTRKRTSAKAGWSCAAVQPKIRSPFNQDMLTFLGTSYFTVERSQKEYLFYAYGCLHFFLLMEKWWKCVSAPVWRSVTDFLFDWQLEFPTRASTQTTTGLSMIICSSSNVNLEVVMLQKLFG